MNGVSSPVLPEIRPKNDSCIQNDQVQVRNDKHFFFATKHSKNYSYPHCEIFEIFRGQNKYKIK